MWRVLNHSRGDRAGRHSRMRLFHRNGLRQVARLVHIASAPHRNVVGKQLQRHHFQNRQQKLRSVRNVDRAVDHLRNF